MKLFNLKMAQALPPEWAKKYGVSQVGLFMDLAYPHDPNSHEGQKQSDDLRDELLNAAITASMLKGKPPLALKLYDVWPTLSQSVQGKLEMAYQGSHSDLREHT